jgi:4-hydroxyphenylpyruvate dioxygenase-like putative hemolysin
MSDSQLNPMGTDGFEFVEYSAPDPQLLRTLFERLGFPVVARHRSKNVTGVLLQIFTQNVIGPIFFEISSARATKASVRVISALCSSRLSWIRCGAGCCSRPGGVSVGLAPRLL